MLNGVDCPWCGGVQTDEDIKDNYSCCIYCGEIVNLTFERRRQNYMLGLDCRDPNYYEDYWDERYDAWGNTLQPQALPAPKETNERTEKIEMQTDEIIKTFIIRVATPIDFAGVMECFEALDGDIALIEMSHGDDQPITDILETSNGQKLAKSLKLDKEKLYEYKIEVSFIMGTDAEKLAIVAMIFDAFDLSIIREEDSTFIIASNRGLAKGLIDTINCEENLTPILSRFITGYEKYLILYSWLDVYGPGEFTTAKAEDIMIMGSQKELIPFSAVIGKGTVFPEGFLDMLTSESELQISASIEDNDIYSFEMMLDTIYDGLGEAADEITICSVRGCDEYILKKGDNINEDDDSQQPTY